MRLVRFGDRGLERPGILDAGGVMRDLSEIVPDWNPSTLSNAVLRQIAALDPVSLPVVSGRHRLGVTVAGIPKFLAIGLNYADLAQAMGRELPSEPVFFTKAISCLAGPDDPIVLPRGSTHTDWEVELGVVIGTRARYVDETDALSHVAGYCLVNDLSEREYQNNRGGTWDKGKGCDTFGPTGPWLVTRDELNDPQDVDLWLEVNGVRWQDGHTRTMIFPVAKLISYLSEFMTLEPGDLIATGTPPGFGAAAKPPVFLRDSDQVRLGSAKLGTQQHLVEAWRAA